MANYNVSGLETLTKLSRLSKESWFVYILKCADNTLYTGITKDVDRRIKEHGTNKGAKYTKQRGPFKLVYKASFPNRSLASKEEYKIKSLSLINKIKLINS
tara:strand:- start:94 stop:396 length:303 start_codon:yes stop_codon:yes gene_type:complete